MLIEKLSIEEKQQIKDYIQAYAAQNDFPNERMASIDTILEPWDKAKSLYLYHLFGERFILEKEVEFSQSLEEKISEMDERIHSHKVAQEFRYKFRDHFCEFRHTFQDKEEAEKFNDAYYGMLRLTSISTLANNEYSGSSFSVPFPNGKTYVVSTGCKPIKAIGKIAKGLGIEEGFEEFQIIHSQALNFKKLKGTLCLSIHPLDYMTMSDNDSGWSSCMSWQEQGCYRQGTVEMLNSSCIVVAYLKSTKTNMSYRGYEWNNKKWRQLFIVDQKFMLSIKGYPYENKELTMETMNFLRSLDNSWNAAPAFWIENWHRNVPGSFGDYYVDLLPCTDYMYNDFGSVPHYLVINPSEGNNLHIGSYNYSGESECMCCGDCLIPNEEVLLCDNCEPVPRCCECGELIGEPYYDANGNCYCESCYDNLFSEEHSETGTKNTSLFQ